MTTTLDDLQKMLSVDGYTLSVETEQNRTSAVITAGEGVCSDCLVPKVVMTGRTAARRGPTTTPQRQERT